MATPFDPRNQTFFILGAADPSNPDAEPPLIPISMPTIDAQRVRLANTSINYGVQLGLILSSLITTLLLLPTRKLRRPIHLTQVLCLTVSATRLALLVCYFPGPLTEYYVAWTRDASLLRNEEYNVSTASSALSVLQLALVEAALALQSRVLVRTWGAYCGPGSSPTAVSALNIAPPLTPTSPRSHPPRTPPTAYRPKNCWWRPLVLLLAVVLAASAVVLRAIWVAHYTLAVKGHTLPVPLDTVGEASVVLGAASVFYFCGIFFAHLALHLAATRRVLRGGGRRKFSINLTLTLRGSNACGRYGRARGLSSLEILAVGNGVLMLAPCLFAGLDVAAGPGNTRVLPFDAGSWVCTLVAAGLPLTSAAAFYRGSDSGDSRRGRMWPDQRVSSHRTNPNSNFGLNRRGSSFFASDETTLPPFQNYFTHLNHLRDPSKPENEEVEVATVHSSTGWGPRTPPGRNSNNSNGHDNEDDLDLEAGHIAIDPPSSREEGERNEDRIQDRIEYQTTVESGSSQEKS
ncbi:fungal pheromone mating factor STE2 GPCR-domain-containing protein [Hypomontagnella monticulosa]|nr:fungal pheromone mating factor STE2 GPCR-domain-containing protein [Hypomontagnella monticulosa]